MSTPKNNIEQYDIGYGKPPPDSQFKKGKSGNPAGRPKGRLNVETIINKAISAKVDVNENGRRKSISKLEASLTQVANKAATGDLKATRLMINLLPLDHQATKNELSTPDLIADRAHALKIAARIAESVINPKNMDEKNDQS